MKLVNVWKLIITQNAKRKLTFSQSTEEKAKVCETHRAEYFVLFYLVTTHQYNRGQTQFSGGHWNYTWNKPVTWSFYSLNQIKEIKEKRAAKPF